MFLGKITRNLAIDRRNRMDAKKRGGGQMPLSLDELAECVGSGAAGTMEDELALIKLLNTFLDSLSGDARRIFLLRYWYVRSIREIAQQQKISAKAR